MRKENVANIQLSSPIYSLVNKGFIMTLHAIIYPTLFLLLCLPVSVAKCILETLQHLVFILVDTFRRFSHFLVPSQQGNHRKSFCCHRKYFAKESRKKKRDFQQEFILVRVSPYRHIKLNTSLLLIWRSVTCVLHFNYNHNSNETTQNGILNDFHLISCIII